MAYMHYAFKGDKFSPDLDLSSMLSLSTGSSDDNIRCNVSLVSDQAALPKPIKEFKAG